MFGSVKSGQEVEENKSVSSKKSANIEKNPSNTFEQFASKKGSNVSQLKKDPKDVGFSMFESMKSDQSDLASVKSKKSIK